MNFVSVDDGSVAKGTSIYFIALQGSEISIRLRIRVVGCVGVSVESTVIEASVADALLSAMVTVRVTCQSLSQLNMYAGSESPPVAKIVPVPQTPLFT